MHLFILCPPYCGSTLLHRIISSSDQVSSTNYYDTREGQQLPELKNKLFIKGRWENNFMVDWPYVKKVWNKYWDHRKPILLEKSPAHLMRAEEIQHHFEPSTFIIMVRNPYAHAEGLMRRNGWDVERAGKFTLKCMNQQKKNISITSKQLLIKYENLVKETSITIQKINEHLSTSIQADNLKFIKSSLNTQKIEALSNKNKEELTKLFVPSEELIKFFGYSLL